MILEDATWEAFGYEVWELKRHSGKPVLAACDECGKIRITSKDNYCSLCLSCARKGKKHPLFGKHHSKGTKAKQRAAHKGKCIGKKNPHYKGGAKVAWARRTAKRKRDLGYTLLLPLKTGEVGHHVTNEYVIGIPKDVHEKFSGYTRKKHRTKVLQWLKAHDKKKYNLVLCVLAKDVVI